MELSVLVIAWSVFSVVRSQSRDGSRQDIPDHEDSAAYQSMQKPRGSSPGRKSRRPTDAKPVSPSDSQRESDEISKENARQQKRVLETRAGRKWDTQVSGDAPSFWGRALSERDIQLGIIMKEVLGPPRAMRPYRRP